MREARKQSQSSGSHPELAQADSVLEFTVRSISEGFGLNSMKQAAVFLTEENKFLLHACTKGLKSAGFTPIKDWFALLA